MAPTVDTLQGYDPDSPTLGAPPDNHYGYGGCGRPGDISAGFSLYVVGMGFTTPLTVQLLINGSVNASAAVNSFGEVVFSYSSAIASIDNVSIRIPGTPPLDYGPVVVKWIGPNLGPPVTPRGPTPNYNPYPTPDPQLFYSDFAAELEWGTADVCDPRNTGIFYEVQRKTDAGGYAVIATGLTDPSYSDPTGLDPGHTFAYRVIAYTQYLHETNPAKRFFSQGDATVVTTKEIWGAVA